MQELLTEKDGLSLIDFRKYRDLIFSIVSYLLSCPDPSPEDEQIETAKSTTKSPRDADPMVSDPFTMAINAVRGRAFEAFVLFVYQDGRKLEKDDHAKIADDVKKLYESALEKEKTRAIMFMFGHYLPRFYFRDRDWIRYLLPQIFPQEPAMKDLYTAAWEGYLFNKLYEEMFFDPEIQKLYERGLALTDADYPRQKHFKEPDEGITEHLALAFMHCKKFGFGHSLFDAFWNMSNPELYANFVNFLGRSFVSGNSVSVHGLLKKEPESKERLRVLWNRLLENYENPKPFIKFGSWIDLDKEIFEPAWLAERTKKTLEKTKGGLDQEDKLTKSIVQLAQANPEDTLEIARWYLLEGGVRGKERQRLWLVRNEWFEALKILHDNPGTKSGTSILINKLIQEGGSIFWSLKEIVDN